MEKVELNNYVFKINNTPNVFWSINLRLENLRFLRDIDPEYFNYQIKVHEQGLKNEELKHQAATSIRVLYYQALETLFTLLGATLQAPHAIHAWIQKVRTQPLRYLIERISNHDSNIFNYFGIVEFNWEAVANKLLLGHEKWAEDLDEHIINLGTFLSYCAKEFTNDHNVNEYNCLKHSIRVKAGGFQLKITPRESEKEKSEQGFNEDVEFGSSFYSIFQLKDNHFQSRRNSIAWDPKQNLNIVGTIALLIMNIKELLQVVNGANKINLFIPKDPKAFKNTIDRNPTVTNLSLKYNFETEDDEFIDKEQMEERLKNVADVTPSININNQEK